jgi:diacylglycerol O-acyltransferase / wax synthase
VTTAAGDQPLAPADAFFLYAESWRVPQTVVAVAIVEASLTAEVLVEHIGGLLDAMPWLRRTIVRPTGGLRRPAWRSLPTVDLRAHIRAAAVPPPGGLAGLETFAATVASRRLSEDRPPWRMWVLPDVGPGQAAYVVAVHHAVSDGPALIELLGPMFLPPIGSAATPGRTTPPATAAGRRAAAVRAARGVALLATDGMVRAGPFTRQLLPARRFATASVPLTTVRAAARAGAGQPTDVVLAALAGAVGADAPVGRRRHTLRMAVPVLARTGSAATTTGNRTAALWVTLPLDEPDPVRRLSRVAADRAQGSTSDRAAGARFVMERVGGGLPAPLHGLAVRGAYRGRFFHGIVSVMPGPRRTEWLGPAEMTAVYPVLPLAERVGLALGGLVWGDALHLGLVGEARALPNPDRLLAAVVAGIERLAAP